MKNNQHYSRFEKIVLLSFFLAASLSLIFFFKFKTLAFPEDNIKFSLNSSQAAAKTQTFLKDLDISSTGYKHVTIFNIDDQAKTYLERQDKAQITQLAQNTIDLWDFNTRFFKPLQKEEFTVSFLPNGRLSGFSRIVEDDRPGASLSQSQAKIIAQQFLKQKTGVKLADWNLIDASIQKRKQRIDYEFIWEKKNLHLKDATYRMNVGLIGDQIEEYSEYLHVPEIWQRQYQKERSSNDLAQSIAEFLALFLFGLSSVIICLKALRNNRNVRIRFGLSAGLIAFSISFLASLNTLPLVLYNYDTTQSWTAYIGQVITGAAIDALLNSLLIAFFVIIGEYVYRQAFPQKIALEHLFSQGLFTKPVNQSLLIGGLFGCITFAYVTMFYTIGNHFGVWSPAEVQYSDIFNTYLPWLYPLSIGFSAAILEEGIFRLFGIPFLMRFVKKGWIAVLITAFSWSFLHSNYPQSPWFIRGLEVGIEGIFLGFLYLRFGILASFAAHYTFDALTTAVTLVDPHHPVNTVISLTLAVILLIIASIFLLKAIRKKGFLEDFSHLINHALPDKVRKDLLPPAELPITELKTTYQPIISPKMIVHICLLLILSIAALFALVPETQINNSPAHVITRPEALNIAEQTMQKKQISLAQYRTVAQYISSPPSDSEQKYLLQYLSAQKLQTLYTQQIPTAFWYIRFFKPLQKDEYHVFLLPTGQLYNLDYVLSEDTQGKNLTKEQALRIANDYLEQEQQENMASYKLVDSSSQKRTHRTDYAFSFEAKNLNVGQAVLRLDLAVLGDKPSALNKYIKFPESWTRQQEATTTTDFIFNLLAILVSIVLLGYTALQFFIQVKQKSFSYKKAIVYSLPLLFLLLINIINKQTLFYASYDTSIPILTYTLEKVAGMVASLVLFLLFAPLEIAFFTSLWKKRFGQFIPSEVDQQQQYLKDALFIGYTFPLIIIGIASAVSFVNLYFKLDTIAPISDILSGIDNFLPAISVLATITSLTLALCFIGILIMVIKRALKSNYLIISILTVFSLAVTLKDALSVSSNPLLVALQIALTLAALYLTLFAIIKIIKTNLLAYFLIAYTTTIFTQAWELLDIDTPFFKLNALSLFLLGLAPILISLFFRLKKNKNNERPIAT